MKPNFKPRQIWSTIEGPPDRCNLNKDFPPIPPAKLVRFFFHFREFLEAARTTTVGKEREREWSSSSASPTKCHPISFVFCPHSSSSYYSSYTYRSSKLLSPKKTVGAPVQCATFIRNPSRKTRRRERRGKAERTELEISWIIPPLSSLYG